MTPLFSFIDGPIIAIIVGVAVLLFGADKIPKLARSMGQAKKEFEAAQSGQSSSSEPPPPPQPPPSPPSQTPLPPQ